MIIDLFIEAGYIDEAINRADQLLTETLESDEPPSFEELADLYRTLDQPADGLTQRLSALRDRVRAACAQSFPPGQKTVQTPVGALERCSVGKTVVWDGHSLAHVLAARTADEAVDPATGEILPPGVLCERVAAKLVAAAGLDTASQTWRVSALKSFGVDPDQYRDTRGGTLSVRFTD